jgi:hypothetical protein
MLAKVDRGLESGQRFGAVKAGARIGFLCPHSSVFFIQVSQAKPLDCGSLLPLWGASLLACGPKDMI